MTKHEVAASLEGIEKSISILNGARHWTPGEVETESRRAVEILESIQQDMENWLERRRSVRRRDKGSSEG